MSGRSSSSIVQDEGVRRRMCRTPKTPIKTGYQTTPVRSDSKRSLFQSTSPSKSDDLGVMTPLSPSSSSSGQSLCSPPFSPNGQFASPMTPDCTDETLCNTPIISSKKIEVKSSLFPDLKVFTPKSRRTPRTPRTMVAKLSTPESQTESQRSYTTPVRKFQRRELFKDRVVAETDSSPSVCSLSQETNEKESEVSQSPTILGIKPLSCESFYGPTPKPQKARTKLFIDTIERRPGGRSLVRTISKESLSSNRSFVSGGTRKRSDSAGSLQRRRSKSSGRKSSGRKKGIQAGVWHNIKKPKQIKKIQKAERPLISPKSRLNKFLSPNKKEIKVKEKALFQESGSRRRIAHTKKRRRTDGDFENEPLDNFTKEKRASISHMRTHPAVSHVALEPDPNKKFMKYGQTRQATFTLNESVKLKISDGVMKLQTPKKRRKLYSGRKDFVEDFNDFDDGDNAIQSSIQGILNILEDDKVDKSGQLLSSQQKVTPSKGKSGRSPLKSVANLPMLIINDFDSDEDEPMPEPIQNSEKRRSEETLGKTGNMISYMTNILVNNDQDVNNVEFADNDTENSPPNKDKFYSLFYKQNWNKGGGANGETGSKTAASTKKPTIVPDDQYLLDAGQESVGIITCKKCGVMYQAGDFADEATHNNFHNHLPELKFTGWNNERVVGRYADGRVVMILNTDPKVWWQKVSKIVEIVDQELGFPEASVQSLFYKTVYLYISEKSKQICGCLIAEECKVAYKMFPPLEGVEIDSCSKDPSPCRVGVSRIWTALSHRRKGVASRLVECLQKTFFYGDIVPLDLIAFSVPSPSGKLFAQKVTGKMDFLVYGFA